MTEILNKEFCLPQSVVGLILNVLNLDEVTHNSYTMGCLPVREDNPRVLERVRWIILRKGVQPMV